MGKTLREMQIRKSHGAQVIAAKSKGDEKVVMIPDGDFRISAGHILIVMGTNEALEKLRGPSK